MPYKFILLLFSRVVSNDNIFCDIRIVYILLPKSKIKVCSQIRKRVAYPLPVAMCNRALFLAQLGLLSPTGYGTERMDHA